MMNTLSLRTKRITFQPVHELFANLPHEMVNQQGIMSFILRINRTSVNIIIRGFIDHLDNWA